MPTLPSDISSFVGGFNLTSANYSGGAGGTYTNLVSGNEAWTVQGATPSFDTRSGLEGMLFTAASNQMVAGDMPALYEATIILIAEPAATSTMYGLGGTYAAGNSWAVMFNGNRCQAFIPSGSSGYANYTSGQPNVFACSWSPFNETTYVQVNNGSVVSATTNFSTSAINWPDAAIGQHRTTYFNGWIARALIFSRALHFRDNATLQALITTEMASIGL